MKCSNCGKTNFEKMPFIHSNVLATHGGVRELAEAHVCMNCGKIEFYMPQQYIDAKKQAKLEQAEYEMKQKELDQKRAKIELEIQKLQSIIKDENNTVKQVREAKEKIDQLNNELLNTPKTYSKPKSFESQINTIR